MRQILNILCLLLIFSTTAFAADQNEDMCAVVFDNQQLSYTYTALRGDAGDKVFIGEFRDNTCETYQDEQGANIARNLAAGDFCKQQKAPEGCSLPVSSSNERSMVKKFEDGKLVSETPAKITFEHEVKEFDNKEKTWEYNCTATSKYNITCTWTPIEIVKDACQGLGGTLVLVEGQNSECRFEEEERAPALADDEMDHLMEEFPEVLDEPRS